MLTASFTLGDVVQIVLLLAATGVAFWKLQTDVRINTQRIETEEKLRETLERRVDKVEDHTDNELKEIAQKIDQGFARVYEKLDSKADKN